MFLILIVNDQNINVNGVCKNIITLNELIIKSDSSLFHKMQSPVQTIAATQIDYRL